MSAPREISAVVVTYQTGPALRQCVAHLLDDPVVTHIIIVDNGNPAADEDWMDEVSAREPHVQVLRGAGNIGFGAACNRGAASASGDWLVFVNPDLNVQRGSIEKLWAFAASQDGVVLVGGRVVGVDGREHRGGRREAMTPWSALVAASGLGRFERVWEGLRDPHREADPPPSDPIRVAAVSGALFVMSRAAFLGIGGFDEGYFLHVEDIDLCRRVVDCGGAVWFHPGAVGVHWGATSRASSFVVERWKARGFARYFRKFARTPWERAWGEIIAAVLGAGFILRGVSRGLKERLVNPLEASPPELSVNVCESDKSPV